MTATQRFLRVILPFAQSLSGKLIGGIRIVTPAPYATDDYYMITVDENEAIFLKEDAAKTVHVVDRDMGCCDCKAWAYRKTCRHTAALAALAKCGKI